MTKEELKVLYPKEGLISFSKELQGITKKIGVGDSQDFIKDTIGSYSDVIFAPTPDNTFLDVGIKLQKGKMVSKEYVESIVVDVQGTFRNINDNSDTAGLINTQGKGKLIPITLKTATEEIGFLERDTFSIKNAIATAQKGFNIVYRDEIDRAGYLGVNGQKGIINQVFNASNDTDSGKALDTMTNTELIDFLHEVVMNQRSGVGSVALWANQLIVPPNVYNRIMMSDYKTYTDKTIEVKLREDSKISITSTYLAGKDFNGLGYDVVIAQTTNDSIVNFVLPKGLTFTPRVKNNFATELGAYYAIAGLDFFFEGASGRGNFK